MRRRIGAILLAAALCAGLAACGGDSPDEIATNLNMKHQCEAGGGKVYQGDDGNYYCDVTTK